LKARNGDSTGDFPFDRRVWSFPSFELCEKVFEAGECEKVGAKRLSQTRNSDEDRKIVSQEKSSHRFSVITVLDFMLCESFFE